MYYASTGGYAGMDTAASSAQFRFGPNNAFWALSKGGASKASGPMTTYNEEKRGTFSVSGWDITVKFSDGKVTTYSAFFEMTRGGEILRLQDKKFSGMTYAVMREKK